MLGGVTIPHPLGLLGHSDADVLVHAIMDSLLGAAALGDIGIHFPDTDPRWAGADSIVLLAAVRELLAHAGCIPRHVDATLVAQAPRVAPFLPQMRLRIASALLCDDAAISIKATTTEGLGFVGAGEGIAAHAVATILRRP